MTDAKNEIESVIGEEMTVAENKIEDKINKEIVEAETKDKIVRVAGEEMTDVNGEIESVADGDMTGAADKTGFWGTSVDWTFWYEGSFDDAGTKVSRLPWYIGTVLYEWWWYMLMVVKMGARGPISMSGQATSPCTV